MPHWADGDRNSDIAIVKAIAIAKIQTVVVAISKSVKLARENRNVNGLAGKNPHLAVLHAAAVSNHVSEIAKKKCPIICVLYRKILMTDVLVLSQKNLHVKSVSFVTIVTATFLSQISVQYFRHRYHCNIQKLFSDACPPKCEYSPWTCWSECSATCGGGKKSRDRECNCPDGYPPNLCENNGQCDGEPREEEDCNTDVECPPECEFSPDWEPWLPCSKTCGGGTKSRQKKCECKEWINMTHTLSQNL